MKSPMTDSSAWESTHFKVQMHVKTDMLEYCEIRMPSCGIITHKGSFAISSHSNLLLLCQCVTILSVAHVKTHNSNAVTPYIEIVHFSQGSYCNNCITVTVHVIYFRTITLLVNHKSQFLRT